MNKLYARYVYLVTKWRIQYKPGDNTEEHQYDIVSSLQSWQEVYKGASCVLPSCQTFRELPFRNGGILHGETKS